MAVIFASGRIFDPALRLDLVGDVRVEDGKIARVGPALPVNAGDRVLDASGCLVVPGLFDMHCHLRDPGLTHKEDIGTGTTSAAAGGLTGVAPMPNTKPVCDSAEVVQYIKTRASEAGRAKVYPIAAVTADSEGRRLVDMESLLAAGAVAFSDDGRPVENAAVMREAMLRAHRLGSLVISHCEDKPLAGDGVMHDGETARKLGLPGIPGSSEEVMVAREILLSREMGARVHIAHVSTEGSCALLRFAKGQGVPVTAETCPHYFALDESAVERFGADAKMNPPLRAAKDREAILEAVADGTIDAIVTDHAPHSESEKAGGLLKAENGVVGFETLLSLSYTYLVKPGRITLARLISLLSANPRAILGVEPAGIEAGKPADLTVFAPDEQWTVDRAKFLSKSKNTPFDGFSLYARVVYTMAGGKITYARGQ